MRLVLILFEVALVAAIVLGAVLAVRAYTARSTQVRPAAEDPREILRRRYAAGEIDEDEYLRRMSGLSQEW
jgi:putative membrane protein